MSEPTVTRRDLGGVAVIGTAAGASTLVADAGARANGRRRDRPTFVFVHGAWHGGWCWSEVVQLLRGGGHTVFTPTLTGLGERAHLLRAGIGLDTHIADVVSAITWEGLGGPVVLCGHSYGGMVISLAGLPAQSGGTQIARLVYLCAFLPQP